MDISKNINKNNKLLNKIKFQFKLPIEFNSKKKEVVDNLQCDLELIKTNENNNQNKSFYHNLLNPQTIVGEEMMKQWAKFYCSDQDFLKDCQKLYNNDFELNKLSCNDIWKSWLSVKNDNNFYNKYIYINWDKAKFLNESSIFLFIFSVYSILSPVINILAPFILLLIPFFILKIMKVPINSGTYIQILKMQLNKQIFGRLFTDFNSINMREKIYSMMTFGMYLYNIYQNFVSFYFFNKNIKYISNFFNKMYNYLERTSANIGSFIQKIDNLNTFNGHKIYIQNEKNKVDKLLKTIKPIKNIKYNFSGFKQIGFMFKQYYLINQNENIEKILLFTFGFNGYIDNINGLYKHIKNKKLNKCTFSEKKNTIQLKQCYLPFISTEKNIVKNNINLKNNLIITGPNASGKTTLIKITLLNILLSQQTGYGFYSKGKITPFDYLHCYINIPDTSSRDSLFQAEARRCKNILDTINNNPKSKHLCIFDELYSGTNPEEAMASAYAYLSTLSKQKKVKFLLTTHFIKLCNMFEDNKCVLNNRMETVIDEKNDCLNYTYKIKKGISKIKGGIYVLKQLNFSKNILEKTKNIIKTL